MGCVPTGRMASCPHTLVLFTIIMDIFNSATGVFRLSYHAHVLATLLSSQAKKDKFPISFLYQLIRTAAGALRGRRRQSQYQIRKLTLRFFLWFYYRNSLQFFIVNCLKLVVTMPRYLIIIERKPTLQRLRPNAAATPNGIRTEIGID